METYPVAGRLITRGRHDPPSDIWDQHIDEAVPPSHAVPCQFLNQTTSPFTTAIEQHTTAMPTLVGAAEPGLILNSSTHLDQAFSLRPSESGEVSYRPSLVEGSISPQPEMFSCIDSPMLRSLATSQEPYLGDFGHGFENILGEPVSHNRVAHHGQQGSVGYSGLVGYSNPLRTPNHPFDNLSSFPESDDVLMTGMDRAGFVSVPNCHIVQDGFSSFPILFETQDQQSAGSYMSMTTAEQPLLPLHQPYLEDTIAQGASVPPIAYQHNLMLPNPSIDLQLHANDIQRGPDVSRIPSTDDATQRTIQQRRNNPGESSHSTNRWDEIKPSVMDLYQDYELKQVMVILELLCGFTATEDALKKRVTEWREERGRKQRGKGTSGMWNTASNKAYPSYSKICIPLRIPRSVRIEPYKSQISLLHCIEKYVKGFFDASAGSRSETLLRSHVPPAWSWHVLLNRCQSLFTIVRKNKEFMRKGKAGVLTHAERNERSRTVIGNLLKSRILEEAALSTPDCSPLMLFQLWGILRLLQGLPCQLGYGQGELGPYVEQFTQSLSQFLTPSKVNDHKGLDEILGHLLAVAKETPSDLLDTVRVSCLCTARALSNRLAHNHPIVLGAWTDYHRYWDMAGLRQPELLDSYETALAEMTQAYGPENDHTIHLLSNYASTAYYICEQSDLAKTLVSKLWGQTCAGCDQDEPLSWNIRTRGMVTAVKIKMLLSYVFTKEKPATVSRRAWRRLRQQRGIHPAPDDAPGAVDHLSWAVEKLSAGDWDSKTNASSLGNFLGRYTIRSHGKGETARRYYDTARDLRLEIVYFEDCVN